MFWHLNFSTHCGSLARIHAIGMRIVGNQEHLIVSAFSMVTRNKQRNKKSPSLPIFLFFFGLQHAGNEQERLENLPTQADNRFRLADHQSPFPIADGFRKNRILSNVNVQCMRKSRQTGMENVYYSHWWVQTWPRLTCTVQKNEWIQYYKNQSFLLSNFMVYL